LEEEEQNKQRYFIDLKWYDQNRRSFPTMVRARFCAACKGKIGTETQERVPTVDPRTGRVVFEMRTVPFGSNPLSAIRGCCSKAPDYITPETPLLEAVFRVFLFNGNQPTDLEGIREQLGEWIPVAGKSHSYSPEVIKRLIDKDSYYGLREVSIGEE
jgi:hypothetical protein